MTTAGTSIRKSRRKRASIFHQSYPCGLWFRPALAICGTILVSTTGGVTVSGATARDEDLLAFTPKPRLLSMKYLPESTDGFLVGSASRKATRWLVKLELGGMLGVLASIVGKDPPDLHYWIAAAPVPPAFVKFEGPFSLNGPIWRIELSGPRWPEESKRRP